MNLKKTFQLIFLYTYVVHSAESPHKSFESDILKNFNSKKELIITAHPLNTTLSFHNGTGKLITQEKFLQEILLIDTKPFQSDKSFKELIKEHYQQNQPFVLQTTTCNIPNHGPIRKHSPAKEYQHNPEGKNTFFAYYEIAPGNTHFKPISIESLDKLNQNRTSPESLFLVIRSVARSASHLGRFTYALEFLLSAYKHYNTLKISNTHDNLNEIINHSEDNIRTFLMATYAAYADNRKTGKWLNDQLDDNLDKSIRQIIPPVDAHSLNCNIQSYLDKHSIQKTVLERADKGDRQLQVLVAQWFRNGQHGFAQDFTESFKWSKKAAEQNDAEAWYNLGLMYLRGEGTLKNVQSAIDAFTQSIKLGYNDAYSYLGYIYHREKEFKDKDKAFNLYKEAIKKSDCQYAQLSLASLLIEDGSVDEAYSIYLKLAASPYKNITAQRNLGIIYEKGCLGKEANPLESIKFYQAAAEQDDPYSQYCLAIHLGKNKDTHEQSFQLLEKAVMSSSKNYDRSEAEYALGRCYEEGIGVEVNIKKAQLYYTRAANKNNIDAQLALNRLERRKTPTKELPSLEDSENENNILEQSISYHQLSNEEKIRKLVEDFNKDAESTKSKLSITPQQFEAGEITITDSNGAVAILQLGKGKLRIENGIAPKTQINYATRVAKFMSNPDQAIAERISAQHNYQPTSSDANSFHYNPLEQKERHAFSPVIDRFLSHYGKDTIYIDAENKKVQNKIIEGSLQLSNGKILKGYFVHGIDDKNIIYHRYFHKTSSLS